MEIDSCPGRYCGYTNVSNDLQCSACPNGYKTNILKHCQKCNSQPTTYDWLFLGFMALLPLMLHWFYILQNKSKSNNWGTALQFFSSIIECSCAAISAILCLEPAGQFMITSCKVERLSDWYTMFYNPQIKYETTIHCTQEAVYPLSSIVFIYYGFSLLFMLFIRPIACLCFTTARKQCRSPIYSALYFHPILIVVHAIIGGLLYYSFPYLAILIALAAIVTYLSHNTVFKLNTLFNGNSAPYPALAIVWHWLVLSYGVSAISELYYLFLVPLPVMFFFATVPLTDPINIASET